MRHNPATDAIATLRALLPGSDPIDLGEKFFHLPHADAELMIVMQRGEKPGTSERHRTRSIVEQVLPPAFDLLPPAKGQTALWALLTYRKARRAEARA